MERKLEEKKLVKSFCKISKNTSNIVKKKKVIDCNLNSLNISKEDRERLRKNYLEINMRTNLYAKFYGKYFSGNFDKNVLTNEMDLLEREIFNSTKKYINNSEKLLSKYLIKNFFENYILN
jgi:hypothetical protein